jgi:S1-C subfamily serine protease
VTSVDLVLIGLTLLMALWGYGQGLIVGASALFGFVIGGLLGSRIGPLVLDEGARSPYAPLSALLGALLLGGLLAATLELVGFRLRRRLGERLGLLDGLGGAALVACLGLILAWMAGAVVLQTPGPRKFRKEVQRSEILRTLNTTLPPSGPILNALARFDPFPAVPGPAPNVRAPSRRVTRDADVRRAGRSVVRVLGTACGLGVQGSGWVADDGVVVTNAHVVAGQEDTLVELRDGSRHEAEAVVFDPRNDLAVLRAAGVAGTPALEIDASAPVGESAAILGYPQNGPYTVRPGRLGPTRAILSQDAYGRGPLRRRVTAIRGLVRSGNSGGPAVDEEGRVVTTIFAATVGSERRNGLGVPASIVAEAVAGAPVGRVGTGPCASG